MTDMLSVRNYWYLTPALSQGEGEMPLLPRVAGYWLAAFQRDLRQGWERQPYEATALQPRAARRPDEGGTPERRGCWPRRIGYSGQPVKAAL